MRVEKAHSYSPGKKKRDHSPNPPRAKKAGTVPEPNYSYPPSQAKITEAKKLGITISKQASGQVSARQLQDAMNQVKKMPKWLREDLKADGKGITLVVGKGATVHPSLKYLRGKKTGSQGDDGRTYDEVTALSFPGQSKKDAIIAINTLNPNGSDVSSVNGSHNVILHEAGHNVDGVYGYSQDKRWKVLSKKLGWGSYFTPVESFAEAFSQYFNSAKSRSQLPSEVRSYFKDYFA